MPTANRMRDLRARGFNGAASRPESDSQKRDQSQPLHVLCRFSDALFDVGDAIAKHVAVLDSHGAVWFGKFGTPLGRGRVAAFSDQIAEDVPTFLYLTTRKAGELRLFRGSITAFAYEVDQEEMKLVPAYYGEKELMEQVGIWARLTTLDAIPNDALDSLTVASSHSTARSALRRSMSGMFIVT